MTAARIIRFSELKTTPWKNGGGNTREIAANFKNGALEWRLSIADVDVDGPFSHFEGLMRILTVIDGKGLDLIAKNQSIEAIYGSPVCFDGALEINAKLKDGPIRDLNLMFNPKLYRGAVTRIDGPQDQTIEADANHISMVLGLHGITEIDTSDELSTGDTLVLKQGSADLRLNTNSAALIITLAAMSH